MSVLSVVIPSYNEQLMVEKAAQKIIEILEDSSIEFELIFVDDGSKDKTKNIVDSLNDTRIRYVENRNKHGFTA